MLDLITPDMATSPKAVREWCRLTCASYPNVEIKNMSTSFRDGLAFCAIIHRHRPDLIDFSSLSKDSVYQNNKLAFETAERRLGIPALLDPKDMVSTRVPDYLSVITYLLQYYYYFNKKSSAGLACSRSSLVTFLNNFPKNKTPEGLKPLKSSTDLGTGRKDRSSNTRPRAVCGLCFKPVHLIQRHLTDGKVYHRSCFRCKVCGSTLLPGSYTQRSDDGSLICSHHITDSSSTLVDLNQQTRSAEKQPKCKFQAGYFSLGGLAISSVPNYTKTIESQDRLVCETPEIREGKERQEISGELKDGENIVVLKSTVNKPARPHRHPPPSVEDRKAAGKAAPILTENRVQQEETKTQEPSELFSPCAQATEGSSRPVPDPRRLLVSSVPVPASRTKTSHPMNILAVHSHSPNSSHITSMSSDRPKVYTNHPWISIVHPGPWTQLPPIPSPILIPRSRSIPNSRRPSRISVAPPSLFKEKVNEDTREEDTKPEPAGQTEASVIHSGNDGNLKKISATGDADAVACLSAAEDTAVKSSPHDDGDVGASSEPAGGTSVKFTPHDEDVGASREAAGDTSIKVTPHDEDVGASREAAGDTSIKVTPHDEDVGASSEAAEDTAVKSTPADWDEGASTESAGDTATKSTPDDDDDVGASREHADDTVVKSSPHDDGDMEASREPAGDTATKSTPDDDDDDDDDDVGASSERAEDTAIKSSPHDDGYVGASSEPAGDTAIRSSPDDDDDVGASTEPAEDTSQLGLSDLEETGNTGGGGGAAASDEAQSSALPRSLSVPAITSAPSQSTPLHLDLTEVNESDQVTSCESKPASKDRKPAMTKSKTFQALSSKRAPAPDHGFPLVKRKVQTDQNVSTADLQVEMSELDKHLEALEQRGIELEGNLRDCKNDEEEEKMLMEWFSLIHEKNVLVRKDTELVHLRKQQELEERQAEVEYELRCLLNKPEGEWSRKDRGREQKLMEKLVGIIEQRNQVVSSLDQDRQREREEDMLSEAMMKDKEFQKEGLKELKKSAGKFNPTKMFKMLKAESNKASVGKKSSS